MAFASTSSSSAALPFLHNLQRYDHLYKVIVIGDQSVGKTNLTLRFCDNVFQFGPQYVGTIGIDFKVRTVEIDGKRIKLQIWDTAGQERFQTITQVYYRGSHGVIFVYDITNHTSFENIKNWIETFDEVTGYETKKMIIGNKADSHKERQVQYHEAEIVAASYNCRLMESSAKTGYNVDNAFMTLAKDIKDYQTTHPPVDSRVNNGLRLTNGKARTFRHPKRKSFFSKCSLL